MLLRQPAVFLRSRRSRARAISRISSSSAASSKLLGALQVLLHLSDLAIFFDDLAQAAMLLHHLRVRRHIGHDLGRRDLLGQLLVAFFDLCKFFKHMISAAEDADDAEIDQELLRLCVSSVSAANWLKLVCGSSFSDSSSALIATSSCSLVRFLRRDVLQPQAGHAS